MAYHGQLVAHEFYDADNPQHPMVLPAHLPFEVVRTEAVAQGFGMVYNIERDSYREERAVAFRHYVRRRVD